MPNRMIDSLIVFRILKMLVTPFKKTQAYRFGFIDERGNRIKTLPDPNNPQIKIENNPKTGEEKNSLTPLHRLVFNLKKLIEKVPFGKSQLASYAVALALLKEHFELDDIQADILCEDFYRHLKDNEALTPETIAEGVGVGKLHMGSYKLRRQLKQNEDVDSYSFKVYPEKTDVKVVAEHSIIYGLSVYVGFIGEERVLVTADDVY